MLSCVEGMVTRYRSETGKYVYFVNPVWTSLLGSNDTTFDKDGGIVFDEIIEKANTDYNILSDDEKQVLAEVQDALSQAMTEKANILTN
jgi:hypothetical protein